MSHDATDVVIILNPSSGSNDHVEAVEHRADIKGYGIEQTERAGQAVILAREAAKTGTPTIIAAGGDGTVNEIVRGIGEAEAFDRTTLGILPVGTGNNFAHNIGISDLDTGFKAIESGDRRRVDVGDAEGHLFVNSCVAGLTADSSSETSDESKRKFGVLAYVINTLQTISEFEELPLSVDLTDSQNETTWSGDAICILVGNGRKFTTGRGEQANMEDGLYDVAVIEDISSLDLMGEALAEQLIGRESPHIFRTQTPSLTVTIHKPDPICFSLDGEIIQRKQLSLDIKSQCLNLIVGSEYDPTPD